VKVADFGLARAVTTTGNTATQGLLMGTVSYLAPELVTEGSADARSDVYSAGILLYELLTGTKPHTGDTPIQVAYAHVHADVPPPSQLVPGIPPYVDALVQRATARDRDLRPADARVFSRQVHRVRSAIQDGLSDDPELTGDLTVPIQQMRQDNEYDDGYSRGDGYVEQPPRNDTIVVPFEPPPPLVVRRPPPATKTPRPQQQRPKKGRGLIALIAVLALAVGVGTAAWYYGIHRYTATPGLLQLTAAQASAKAGEVGLTTTLANQDFSEDVPKGQVMATDPEPGARIRKEGQISLTVSKGPERYRVPQLAGLDEDAAKRALSSIKLVTGQLNEAYSETVPTGRVIGFFPKFDTLMKPGDSVNLVISKGKKPIGVPDMTGKTAKEAIRTLKKAGFTIGRTDQFDEKVPEGKVISQTPNSGTLFAKDKVQLVVSKGPPLVEVPNVRSSRPWRLPYQHRQSQYRSCDRLEEQLFLFQ
jgi:serine/threonine-protein kinase